LSENVKETKLSGKKEQGRFASSVLSGTQWMEAFCEFLKLRTGIIIQDHQLQNLSNSVSLACKQFGYLTAEDYLDAMKMSAAVLPELEFLISAVTVQESYFFRDQEQVNFLKDTWFPEIIERKQESGEKTLRIWSAGCSGGQEIYTIAILLNEIIHNINEWEIFLLGTDINTNVLSNAGFGRYLEWSLRSTPKYLVQKYFLHEGNDYVLNPEICKMVKFSYLNLAEENFSSVMKSIAAFDMIMCRNVFIYMDKVNIEKILKKFSGLLSPEGILLLGASDLIDGSTTDLKLHHRNNVFHYRKEHIAAIAPQRQFRPAKMKILQRKGKNKTVAPQKKAFTKQKPAPDKQHSIDQEVMELDKSGRWSEIPPLVDSYCALNGEKAFLVSMKAKALASLGDFNSAVTLCKRSIELDRTCKCSYYIMATVMNELGDIENTQNAFRKAIYLDHNFPEAHFQLGQTLMRLHKYKAGLKSLKNALELAEKMDPNDSMFLESELNYGQLVEILKDQIGFYENQCKKNEK